MLALIDESTPTGPLGVHYVVSSAVILEDADGCREHLAKLTSHRARPFHWATEGDDLRDKMMSCFADLAVSLLTVIHHPVKPKRQNEARASAMGMLVTRLTSEGVGTAIIESRGIQDADDRQTIVQAQHDGLVSNTFCYTFEDKTQPLLWLPDASAGIYSEAELGVDSRRVLTLHETTNVLDVLRIHP